MVIVKMSGFIFNCVIILMLIVGSECLPAGDTDWDGNGVRHDKKRSVYTSLPSTVSLQHVVNATTVVCNDAMNVPFSRRVQLNDEQMRAIFQDKGGNYVRDYMAATQEEAIENFPNMLILLPASTVPGSNTNFSSGDNVIAKETVMTDLHKLSTFIQSMNTTRMPSPHPHGEKLELQNVTGNDNENISVSSEAPHTTTVPRNSSVFKTSTTTSSALISDVTSSTMLPVTGSATRGSSKMATSQTEVNVKDSTMAASSTGMNSNPTDTGTFQPTSVKDGYTTTINPDVLKGLDQLKQYVHGVSRRDLDAIWRDAETTLHPSVLMDLSERQVRRKRNVDGSTTREEYCQLKGHLTEDGNFKHLCSMCASTTKLPDDIFPRYINEVVCKTGDTDCFTVGDTVHGQCKQTRFSLNMMQKKPGVCRMLLHGGETLVFEDWVLTPKTIRVSCECTINKLSVFSQYIAHDIPIG